MAFQRPLRPDDPPPGSSLEALVAWCARHGGDVWGWWEILWNWMEEVDTRLGTLFRFKRETEGDMTRLAEALDRNNEEMTTLSLSVKEMGENLANLTQDNVVRARVQAKLEESASDVRDHLDADLQKEFHISRNKLYAALVPLVAAIGTLVALLISKLGG